MNRIFHYVSTRKQLTSVKQCHQGLCFLFNANINILRRHLGRHSLNSGHINTAADDDFKERIETDT